MITGIPITMNGQELRRRIMNRALVLKKRRSIFAEALSEASDPDLEAKVKSLDNAIDRLVFQGEHLESDETYRFTVFDWDSLMGSGRYSD